MTMSLRSALHVLLAALLLGLALFAALRLYPLFQDFDTVAVPIVIQERPDSVGKVFDEIILDNIHSFRYIKSLNHVFQKGPLDKSIDRGFFMDRCEVSQNDFRVFANWIKLHEERARGSRAFGQPDDWKHTSNTQEHSISGKLSAPASGVTYFDAHAYCKVAGGRLPTEHEWIAAASGPGQNLYPWGNTFQRDSLPYLDPLLNAAQKCGTHPGNATPLGVFDLAGNNVSEWASNSESPLEPVIMGGNAYNQPRAIYHLNALYRFAPPVYRSPYVGFRCIYDRPVRRTPWHKEIDSVEIPAGVYAVGVPEDARIPKFLFNAAPEQIAIIEEFFQRPQDSGTDDALHVMRAEVTRRQYQRFLDDSFVQLKIYADRNEPEGHSYRPPDFDRQLEDIDLPVSNVDWWSAYAFSRWAGGRLPRAEEWAVVASSLGQNVYPWGNDGNVRYAARLQAPKSNPLDETEQGVYDMGGNVSEWTQSVTSQNGKVVLVVKGGNYLLPSEVTAMVGFNNFVSPHYRSPSLGFRVVFDR